MVKKERKMRNRNPFQFFSNDIGIDLGTSNTVVCIRGTGIVLSEPSIVAFNAENKEVLAVGTEAKRMLGRTPSNIIAMKPLRDGVIADFEATEMMLRYFINKVRTRRHRFILPPRIIIAIPSGITNVEKRAVQDTALKAGARAVYLVEEPMAAAIGVGLPVDEPTGSFIIDIGGGTTEMAVISLGGIVAKRSIRVAGNEMDEAIIEYLKKKHNLLIGERTAEEIKISIGSTIPLEEEKLTVEVNGRDLIEGLPKTINVHSEEIREAIKEPLWLIVNEVHALLEQTPPELSSDLAKQGLTMSGGGSLLRGIDKLLSRETKVPVNVAQEPLLAVVKGTGKILEEVSYFKSLKKEK